MTNEASGVHGNSRTATLVAIQKINHRLTQYLRLYQEIRAEYGACMH